MYFVEIIEPGHSSAGWAYSESRMLQWLHQLLPQIDAAGLIRVKDYSNGATTEYRR